MKAPAHCIIEGSKDGGAKKDKKKKLSHPLPTCLSTEFELGKNRDQGHRE